MDREEIGNDASKYAIIGNILLTILNATVGVIGGSSALVAQAADNAGDLISNLIGYWAFRFGLKPADSSHPYGHGRIEPVVGLLIAILLFFIAYQIFQEAYTKFLMIGVLTPPAWITAVMAIIALILNYIIMNYLFQKGGQINSQVIIATANQKKTDVYTSIAIFVGIVGAHLGYPILDPIMAVIIGILIVRTAYNLANDNINNILGKVPNEEIINDIMNIALTVKGVYEPHNIKINMMGPYASAELHIEVRNDLPLDEAHEISDKVERTIIEKVEIINTVIVHVEPLKD